MKRKQERRNKRPGPRLTAIVLGLALLLSACGAGNFNAPVPCPAPALAEYPPEFLNAAAGQLERVEADLELWAIKVLVGDYYAMRQQIRVCKREGE